MYTHILKFSFMNLILFDRFLCVQMFKNSCDFLFTHLQIIKYVRTNRPTRTDHITCARGVLTLPASCRSTNAICVLKSWDIQLPLYSYETDAIFKFLDLCQADNMKRVSKTPRAHVTRSLS